MQTKKRAEGMPNVVNTAEDRHLWLNCRLRVKNSGIGIFLIYTIITSGREVRNVTSLHLKEKVSLRNL